MALGRAMKWPGSRIQRVMVLIIFLAIFLWAGREIVPDFARRWQSCRRKAAYFSQVALQCDSRAQKSRSAGRPAAESEWLAHAAGCRRKSNLFRRALYLPWELYALETDLD